MSMDGPAMHKVIVYGSLKQGMPNHGYLSNAIFLGEDTLAQVTLYDLGFFPGAKLEESQGIVVEVYTVNQVTLQRLDRLEGFIPGQPELSFYRRTRLSTRFGEAWIYLYAHAVDDMPAIRRGAWPG